MLQDLEKAESTPTSMKIFLFSFVKRRTIFNVSLYRNSSFALALGCFMVAAHIIKQIPYRRKL